VAQEDVIDFGGRPLPGIERDRVTAWLAANTPVEPPVEFALIAAGGSNLTYRLDDSSGSRWVLRRPPVGELLATAHDVVREHRILQGLGATAVPVPEVVGVCTDAEVTGAPFFVMRYVQGMILRTTSMAEAVGPEAAATVGRNFFEALAVIHTTPPESAGLESLSRPDGYVERQLRRWHEQYRQTAGDDAVVLEAEVHGRLATRIPADVSPGTLHLVHGDYHIDNAVFGPDLSVEAIFDWELAALGHPIADLAWALLFWAEPGDPDPFLREPASIAPGFPTRVQAVAAYQRRCGYDVSALPYFEGLAAWRMACLLSGTRHRARQGAGGGLQARGGAPTDQLARINALFEKAAARLDDAG
jgi:aminoglycoside phosphotransferase (APT) family kinase protein